MNSLWNVRLVSRKYYKRLNDSEEKEEVQSDDYPSEPNDPRRQTNIKRVSYTFC